MVLLVGVLLFCGFFVFFKFSFLLLFMFIIVGVLGVLFILILLINVFDFKSEFIVFVVGKSFIFFERVCNIVRLYGYVYFFF